MLFSGRLWHVLTICHPFGSDSVETNLRIYTKNTKFYPVLIYSSRFFVFLISTWPHLLSHHVILSHRLLSLNQTCSVQCSLCHCFCKPCCDFFVVSVIFWSLRSTTGSQTSCCRQGIGWLIFSLTMTRLRPRRQAQRSQQYETPHPKVQH